MFLFFLAVVAYNENVAHRREVDEKFHFGTIEKSVFGLFEVVYASYRNVCREY